jgi:chromate transporter
LPKLKDLTEVGAAFLRLGCTSFGGAFAHLGYFRTEFVERRRWLDDAAYADIVALCQFLPGPASSQVVFVLGMRRAGVAGALVASLCFMLPSAVLMIAFGYGIYSLGDLQHVGWLHGLRLTAVAVVAAAAWDMGSRLCPDWSRRILGVAAAAVVLLFSGAVWQIGAIAGCALAGVWVYRGREPAIGSAPAGLTNRHAWAAAALALFAVLLFLLPMVAAVSRNRSVEMFGGFYRVGSLVFGGGHIVLPLLRTVVVPPGWISDSAFLAGYGAAQALPGPLFTFAGFLGTAITRGEHAWLGGILGLFAIYLPAWLLVGGTYPFWHLLRSQRWARSALDGINASVVGILVAALYRPLFTENVANLRDAAAVVAAFLAVRLGIPPWALVVLMAAAGECLLR